MSTISFLYISYFEELWHKNPSTLVRCQGLTINTNVCQSTYFLIWLGACSSAWLSWKSQSWTWKLWRIDFHQERSIASKALAQCHTPEENGRSPWKWLWIIWPLWSSTNQEKDKTYIYIYYICICVYIYTYIFICILVYIYIIFIGLLFFICLCWHVADLNHFRNSVAVFRETHFSAVRSPERNSILHGVG
jgi:hypothetical protein